MEAPRSLISHKKYISERVISGFRREADDKCGLLGCYTANGGNFLLAFREYIPVTSTRVRNPKIPQVRIETKHHPFY